MDFYLSFNNGAEQLRLPVTPSAFEMQQRHNNTVVNLTNLGDINLIGKSGLASISITSFFPAQAYYFCKYTTFPTPYECVKMLQTWKKSGRPIRLIVTESPINYAVSIEAFNFGEQDGTRDVYFTLELKEYIFTQQPKPQQVTTTNGISVSVPSTERETKALPKTYKVQQGDTMPIVAKKVTGDMNNANAIAKANKVSNWNNLTPGLELII